LFLAHKEFESIREKKLEYKYLLPLKQLINVMEKSQTESKKTTEILAQLETQKRTEDQKVAKEFFKFPVQDPTSFTQRSYSMNNLDKREQQKPKLITQSEAYNQRNYVVFRLRHLLPATVASCINNWRIECGLVSSMIKEEIKNEFKEYKVIVGVRINRNVDQPLLTTFKCFWHDEINLSANYVMQTDYFKCVTSIFMIKNL
jgi:hypothetical protein